MTRKVKAVEFTGSRGETLAARLDLPSGEPVACALFAHCFTCSKDFVAAARISSALAERGIAVLRFDFTGLGESEGDFGDTNFSSNVDDLIRAARFLNDRRGGPDILVGHSLGGAAVLAAADSIPDCRAVATIGAPCDPDHVRRHLRDAVPEIEARGEAVVEIGGRPFRIRRQFLEDIAGQKMVEAIGSLDRSLLVFHAPGDAVVGIDSARRIFEAARHPKSFVSLDDADHLLTRPRDADYVAAVLAAWSSRYLPATAEEDEEPSAAADPPQGEDGEETTESGLVRVRPTGDGKFTQRVTAGRHRFLADEPQSHGGDDRGPSPYELLSASLGTCTSMTLRMYADRKGWPLEDVTVELEHEKVHAEDCAECETETGKIDRIERRIDLRGALTLEQRLRLLEIADRCPVHRTLHAEIRVETRLRDRDAATEQHRRSKE